MAGVKFMDLPLILEFIIIKYILQYFDMDLIDFYKLKSDLTKLGELKFRIASDSMHPLLKVDSVVTVTPLELNKLKRFDVIIFWENDRLISHFLWAKQQLEASDKSIYITKSLREPKGFDLPLKDNLLLGKLDVKIPILTKLKIILMNYYK
jgi:hypothetical protein